jgi:excisionase family DNA binding protein
MSAALITTRQLLTTKEVAVMLRVEPMTVYNLRMEGKLASLKIGRTRRYRIEDVEKDMADAYEPAKSEEVTPIEETTAG